MWIISLKLIIKYDRIHFLGTCHHRGSCGCTWVYNVSGCERLTYTIGEKSCDEPEVRGLECWTSESDSDPHRLKYAARLKPQMRENQSISSWGQKESCKSNLKRNQQRLQGDRWRWRHVAVRLKSLFARPPCVLSLSWTTSCLLLLFYMSPQSLFINTRSAVSKVTTQQRVGHLKSRWSGKRGWRAVRWLLDCQEKALVFTSPPSPSLSIVSMSFLDHLCIFSSKPEQGNDAFNTVQCKAAALHKREPLQREVCVDGHRE